jgi:histone H1/5
MGGFGFNKYKQKKLPCEICPMFFSTGIVNHTHMDLLQGGKSPKPKASKKASPKKAKASPKKAKASPKKKATPKKSASKSPKKKATPKKSATKSPKKSATKSFKKTFGSKAEVFHGTAKYVANDKNKGRQVKSQLMKNKAGRIVSKAKHSAGKKSMEALKDSGKAASPYKKATPKKSASKSPKKKATPKKSASKSPKKK